VGASLSDDPAIVEFYTIAEGDVFSAEHEQVLACIEDLLKSVSFRRYYYDFDLKEHECAKPIVTAKPAQARRYFVAALNQVRHWDRIAKEFIARFGKDPSGMNSVEQEQWYTFWPRRQLTGWMVSTLLRKKMPLEYADLKSMAEWLAERDKISSIELSVPGIAKAFDQHRELVVGDVDIGVSLKRFAQQIRRDCDSEWFKYALLLEEIVGDNVAESSEQVLLADLKPSPQRAPAGCPAVMSPLKQLLGIAKSSVDVQIANIGPDEFPLRSDSPYVHEHSMLTRFFEQLVGTRHYNSPDLRMTETGQTIMDVHDELAGPMFLAAAERHIQSLIIHDTDYMNHAAWQSRYIAASIIEQIPILSVEWPRNEAFDALLYLAFRNRDNRDVSNQILGRLINTVESIAAKEELSEGERYVLALYRVSLLEAAAVGNVPDEVTRLTKLIGDGLHFCLSPGEAWTDAVNEKYSSWTAAERAKWNPFFKLMLSANPSKPTAKWLQTAKRIVENLTPEAIEEQLLEWLPLVSKGRSVRSISCCYGDTRGPADTMKEDNATALKGILWCVPLLSGSEMLSRCVTEVAISAYKKVPGVGPRAPKVGNAGVYALSELGTTDAVGQLAKLKVRIKSISAQKEIEKAFNKAAEALNLPREEIEEMGVPSYGLEDVGCLSQEFGDYRAELTVTGLDAALTWFDGKNKALKSVPAKAKAEFGDDLKELNQTLKDVKSMLPAQRDRIDSMFLLQKSWPLEKWRERYLEHPLVGTIASRLIWCVDGQPALFVDGAAVDHRGERIVCRDESEITLWHPVGRGIEEILAWRNSLEERQITQPFKQAHREVYLLTVAEENTNVYSNRYAAHVIRQHQFNALCGARGWKNKLRLMVDDEFPPATKLLPEWGLRAEFWVQGIGDDFGADTNETGTFHFLATDQVRFYRILAAQNSAYARAAGLGTEIVNEPLPLDQIPPLVFSEIMRDVDLFVGVASVGNDPTWQDGGPQGRYRSYWDSYSFGELTGSAGMRKQVLERLVPRLKIADRCSLTDRFLVVRGNVRTYKIHFGSGNILMEPNGQYLCIVPDARMDIRNADLFLPFEGDRTLSIIISKALLLAADDKIKDPTIVKQIQPVAR
jgi:hypothetical protein